MSKLMIVESPAKAKTIGKYLGGDFKVLASVGHVRDLPKKGGLSIKIDEDRANPGDWTFTPTYEVSDDKEKVVQELRKAAKSADEIYLAPDPDREGEAIAWHLSEVLSAATKGKKVYRVTYNEITKNAVSNAIAHPGEIDMKRVDAQQARRILDRLVGFQVSPMLWKYLNYGRFLSAGRVQSAALRILVEREREISAFVPETYFVMGVEARKEPRSQPFTAKLSRYDGAKPKIGTAVEAQMIIADLDGSGLRVVKVKDLPKTRHAPPPFTTSTLQQAASSTCGYTPHVTMSIAQKLYEEGLITYMRTDSVNVADVARAAAAKLIETRYGKEYLPEKPNIYRSKAGSQGAHEAIRPTDVTKLPGAMDLEPRMLKLYDLIWKRFMASQMGEAKLSLRTVEIEAEKPGLRHSYLFTASMTTVLFDGWLRASGAGCIQKRKAVTEESEDGDEVDALPPLAEGDSLIAGRWLSEERQTKPPPRFSEASLVKALEENGVGRPSTYAATIEVLVNRQYAERKERQLVPTQRGMDVNDWLVSKMGDLFNVGYTAEMEAELDKVEEGDEKGDAMLSRFFRKFQQWLKGAKEPPPPTEKFTALFDLLSNVKEWKEPVTMGKRTFSDELFVDSVKEQIAEGRPVSEKQLSALVKLAIAYRDQIPDGEMRLIDLGWGLELDKVKNAPSEELVKWCFHTIDRIGGMDKNPFLNSLREQVDRGRLLTQKQFIILAKSVGENSGSLPDGEAVRARLAPYVGGEFETAPTDPAVPELLSLVQHIKEWKEPLKRGRRVYNDKDFATSLGEQYARRKSLSPRQAHALRRILYNYRDQIPDFDKIAARLEIDKAPSREKTLSIEASAEADAKAAARADARRMRRAKARRQG